MVSGSGESPLNKQAGAAVSTELEDVPSFPWRHGDGKEGVLASVRRRPGSWRYGNLESMASHVL